MSIRRLEGHVTRTKFKTEIKMYALNERKKGVKWGMIRESIQKIYEVKPPTIRAMEKWEKNLDSDSVYSDLLSETKKKLPQMQKDIEFEMAQSMFPVVKQAKETGGDMEAATWKWFFNWAENYIGKEKFINLTKEYLKDRGEL
jgi:hypothetical protein